MTKNNFECVFRCLDSHQFSDSHESVLCVNFGAVRVFLNIIKYAKSSIDFVKDSAWTYGGFFWPFSFMGITYFSYKSAGAIVLHMRSQTLFFTVN